MKLVLFYTSIIIFVASFASSESFDGYLNEAVEDRRWFPFYLSRLERITILTYMKYYGCPYPSARNCFVNECTMIHNESTCPALPTTTSTSPGSILTETATPSVTLTTSGTTVTTSGTTVTTSGTTISTTGTTVTTSGTPLIISDSTPVTSDSPTTSTTLTTGSSIPTSTNGPTESSPLVTSPVSTSSLSLKLFATGPVSPTVPRPSCCPCLRLRPFNGSRLRFKCMS